MKVLRVALPGYNALTDTDPRHFTIFSDQDNVLIKEFTRGSELVDDGVTHTVAHNLNYLPHFYIYTEVSSGRYKLSNNYNTTNLPGFWSIYANTTNVYIKNQTGTNDLTAKWFIFYDNVN